MPRIRSTIVIAGISATLGLAGALAAPAGAAVTGPAIADASGPFHIGPSSSSGTVALTANGSRVIVYDISSGKGKTKVCLMPATGRKCGTSVLLSPPSSQDDTGGTPGVFIPSKNHVVVLQATCCDSISDDSTVLYTSTDGGKTFSAPVRVSSLGVNTSELVGSHVIFTQGDSSDGLQVDSVPVTATGPNPTATISTRVAYDVALGQYKGGALVGTDFSGKTSYTAYVYYAAKGSDFDSAASYHSVGKFDGDRLLAMSGAALLMENYKTNQLVLRMFTGKGFGPARSVAHLHGGLGTWITLDQDPSGHVHVFDIMSTAGYELLEVSTSNGGVSWTSTSRLGDGISSTVLSAAVNSHDIGLVVGTSPAIGYPVP